MTQSVPRSSRTGRARRRPVPPAPAPEPSSHAIRAICVEDHPLVIDGLRAQFGIDGRIEIVAQSTSAADLVALARRHRPHIVLLDIELPGPDAFEAADRLRHECPEVRMIVLSAYARSAYVTAAFNAGACAYFTKSDDIHEIIAGIRAAVDSPPGAFLLGPTIQRMFRATEATPPRGRAGRQAPAAADSRAPLRSPLSMLSPRELEVLRLIGKGLGRVQIAAQLVRSVKTIDGHRDRLMKKLGIPARADLVRFAIREGLAQA